MTQSPIEPAPSWYRVPDADSDLEQGEQLFDFSLLSVSRDEYGAVIAIEQRADLIVLTQRCDLAHGKVGTVLMAPVTTLPDWIVENPSDLDRLEEIRQGFDTSLYLLPAWPDDPHIRLQDDRVVDFGTLHSVAVADIAAAFSMGGRVSLASPAREHFGQAVARSFMRVGLPIDVPSFRLDKVGTDKRALDSLRFEGNEDLVGPRALALARPLSITLQRRVRAATGEEFLRLVTTEQPSVVGAGRTMSQAERSLARQLARRLAQWRGGDVRWAWVGGAVVVDD